MKAIVYNSYGGPDVLRPSEVPIPVAGPGQVLIRVVASSVNGIDLKVASAKIWPIYRANFPQIPGCDIAGEVVSCGPGVSGFPPGTRVHALQHIQGNSACAEYALASVDVLTPMPNEMDFATGAGLPLAGMTALQGLRNYGGLQLSGCTKRVLVLGASGGVGHIAVQIAKAAGATVVAVCSGRNRALVESLGADEVFDYSVADPYKNLKPCDVIFDCIGQYPSAWMHHLNEKGRFVTSLPSPLKLLHNLNFLSTKSTAFFSSKTNEADLRILDELVSAGKLRVVVQQRFPLEQLKAAWELSISGRAVGKIIVDVAM